MRLRLLLFCLVPILAFGQTHRCVTDSLHRYKLNTDAQYKQQFLSNSKLAEAYQLMKVATNDTLYTIPVVVHVIYHADNAAVENISDEQVQSQLDVLNEDYNISNENILDVPAIWQTPIRMEITPQALHEQLRISRMRSPFLITAFIVLLMEVRMPGTVCII
ncbi:MAG: hypothetical protein RLZZ94_1901 [Bacteroidota bacterium]